MMRVFAIIVGLAIVIGIASFFSAISWHDESIGKEEGVKAQYRDNQNEYDNFWKKVQETAQVPQQYKDDFKELLAAETTAKYGKDGSQATMQWFKDRNISFPDTMYLKLMNIIEAGRNDFKRGQTLLLDKQKVFSVSTKTFWGHMLAGYWDIPSEVRGALAPTKDLDGDNKLTVLDYPILLSKRTNEAFAAGEDEPVNVFGKKQ